jgi:CheY-like chemotaxis protein
LDGAITEHSQAGGRFEVEERDPQTRTLEVVGRLASGMAHDFNNLLTVIAGYTAILLDAHQPSDPDHEALTQIHRAAERAAALIRQLLAVAAPPAVSETPARVVAASLHGGATILVVDDEDAVRTLARQILQMQGYTILEACDGEEALEVYAQHADAIDLLVTDVVMPRRTGPDLAQRLTEREPTLPVLFLSGCNRDDADLGQSLGGRQPHFLAKPFRPVDLVRLVGEILSAGHT